MLMPAASASTDGFYVLCYHAIKEKKDPYSLSPETFKKNIEQLQQSGFTFITFDDVKNGRIKGNKNILVTIDDGNESVWDAYYRIMKPAGIKPVLGIYPAIIGKRKYVMTWEQVAKLKDEGCYIAAHGYNHMFLSSKYYKEDIVQFKKEIYLSKKVLEQKLGITIDAMVYPFGVHSDESLAMMKDAGYRYGFTLDQKKVRIPIEDGFHIPRYMMTKPAYKGIMAHLIKHADKEETLVASVSSSEKQVKSTQPVKEKVTIRNYPDRLKKLIINDVVFMPDEKPGTIKKQQKHTRTAVKPVVKSTKSGEAKNRKIKYFPARENKKMTGSDSKVQGKKHSFLYEVRDFYFTLLERSSSFVTAFKQTAWAKLEQVKQKTAELFS